MGKGTDKLYVTHSEWSDDSFAAGAGSGALKSKAPGASFRRLPFNFCAVSLQPFNHPVCTATGTTYDLTQVLPWIKKHGTNPVDGTPLKSQDLIKLNFIKNDDNEYVDPVTYKPLTNNTHIIALSNTGNVFAWDTIDRLNIKTKNWRDLVSDAEFSRKDIITLQDPQHLDARDLSTFKHLKDGSNTLTEEQQRECADPTRNLNLQNMGNAARILKAKEAVAKSKADRSAGAGSNPERLSAVDSANQSLIRAKNGQLNGASKSKSAPRGLPYNAAGHTTGQAAASLTSTGVTPYTGNEPALLTEEQYLLKPKMVKERGYARIQTNLGDMNIELQTEYAPKAVWNFIHLAKQGYYHNMQFHRNIRNFMIQGGDPTGTGRGGQSVWGKPFADEYGQSPLAHNARGILSMANKGKNTNTSQFFILYRPAKHLDRKHTIFGRVIEDDAGGESQQTLSKLENVETENDKPTDACLIEDIVVFVDPFEEFRKRMVLDGKKEAADTVLAEERQDFIEDASVTWSGKRIRHDGTVDDPLGTDVKIGKYMDTGNTDQSPVARAGAGADGYADEWEDQATAPPAKKRKAGAFGNFDNW